MIKKKSLKGRSLNSQKIFNKKDFKKNLIKKPTQREIWEKISKSWGIYVVKKIPQIIDFLKNKKGNIIDFGCGNGRNLIFNKNLKYYCVDFSKEQINSARKYAKKNKIIAKFFVDFIEKLDRKNFKDNFFDYGLYISTLHCLENLKKRENSLKEFYRILKPNARALISVWDYNCKFFKNCEKEIYMVWKENYKSYFRYYYLYDKQEFLDILKKIGFKIIKIYSQEEHNKFSKKNLIIEIRKPNESLIKSGILQKFN